MITTINKEIESKFSLSRTGFKKVLSLGVEESTIEQTNVYYDSQWRLDKIGGTFRIRFSSEGSPLITLKLKKSQIEGVRVADELEFPATNLLSGHESPKFSPQEISVSKDLPMDVAKRLLSYGITVLYQVGSMRNTRHVLRFAPLGKIELDCAHLPNNKVFYEAEIEDKDPDVRHQLGEIILRVTSGTKPSTISKFQRFRSAIR